MDQKAELIVMGSGTSQGIPVIGCDCRVCKSTDPRDKRTRSSVHFILDGLHVQVDTGPDFRTQMLREELGEVDAVLFTHEHQDHIAGLDDVRPMIFRTGNAMEIYGQQRVLDRIRKAFHYAFETQPYPGAPRIETNVIDESASFKIGEIEILPIPVLHGKLPILGYRIGKMAYITDVNHIDESIRLERLQNLDVLFLDALHHKVHYSHYTLEQAIETAKLIGAKTTYFIHMSHYMGTHEETQKQLPEGMYLSYDGMRIEFDYASKDK
jgi:phosphoribosyl 1,2-cyclic phosphate phosphodiesterase